MDDQGQSIQTLEILTAILDNSPECIVLISPEHKVLAFNKVIKEVLKLYFGREIKVGDDYRDFVAPGSKELYHTSFQKATMGSNEVVIGQTTAENTSVWFEFKMNPVYNQSKTLLGVTLTAKNIDKEKRMQMEMENMAEMFEAIIENASESILLFDKDHKVLMFNKVAKERLLNFTSKEIYQGVDFNEFLNEWNRESFFTAFEKALQGYSSDAERDLSKEYNADLWVLSKMFPVYRSNGELLGVSLFTIDINERKQAQIAMAESEEKFRKILESVPLAILILDKDLKIRIANDATEEIFGYSSDELEGQKIEILVPERFRTLHHKNLKQYLVTPSSFQIKSKRLTTALKKGKKEIIAEVNLNLVRIKNEDFILLIVEDVTDRIKAEQKNLNQLRRLETIAWQQSHEVRRPVANILGLVNTLRKEELLDFEKKISLDYLFEMTEELDSIIKKIVLYASGSDLKNEIKK
ncbi:PAS sensor protein [Sporocytophaga myxococcoides]|uniref:histidine kinase n=1 Tax=Sporocytophaga myxococcoides TaxID=153721 RepID=A0A098LB18_9BACT|nr:PAS domain S-box protein [Sporocytophaga myxococcoides]GAL83363.1 PAS sensor protein [Sporocytophaga myxococcoides]